MLACFSFEMLVPMEKTAVMLLSSQFSVCARFTCFNTSLIRADPECISALTEFRTFSANFVFFDAIQTVFLH